MSKVGIVTDSVACLPLEVVKQYDLRIVPLNIYYDGTVYQEGVNITPTEAYELLEKDPDKFTTSPGSAGDYFEAYRGVSEKYRDILCITLSSKLSTLYNMARVAREEAKDKLPKTNIRVLDSLNAASGEGLVVLAAARAAAEEKSLAEIIKVVEMVKDRVSAVGVFETIRHVYRTGRIPKIATQVLAKLNIKPLFSISGGSVHITGVTRTKAIGLRRQLNTMKERIQGRPAHIFITHANVPDEGQRLKEQIAAEFDCADLYFSDFSPIMGYATGKGTLLIAFYTEES